MLLTEWDTEEAKVVWREEGREEVTRNALAKGIPLELIHDITGFDEEALKQIQARL